MGYRLGYTIYWVSDEGRHKPRTGSAARLGWGTRPARWGTRPADFCTRNLGAYAFPRRSGSWIRGKPVGVRRERGAGSSRVGVERAAPRFFILRSGRSVAWVRRRFSKAANGGRVRRAAVSRGPRRLSRRLVWRMGRGGRRGMWGRRGCRERAGRRNERGGPRVYVTLVRMMRLATPDGVQSLLMVYFFNMQKISNTARPS